MFQFTGQSLALARARAYGGIKREGNQSLPTHNYTGTMLKTQAVSEFRECIGNSYRGDKIAQREAWLNFLDTLCEKSLISQHQRDNWSTPIK